MKRIELLFGFLRVPADALAASCAMLLSFLLRERSIDLIPGVQLLEPPLSLPSLHSYIWTMVVPGTILFLGVAALLGLYAFRVTSGAWREVGVVCEASLLWLVLIIGWYFLVRKELFFSRIVLLQSIFFLTVFACFGRCVLTLMHRAMLRRGIGIRRVVSFGSLAPTDYLVHTLHTDVRYRYMGHVRTVAELHLRYGEEDVDLVLHTDPNPTNTETHTLIDECRSRHIDYAYLPHVFADAPHQLLVEHVGLMPIVRFRPTPLDGWGRIGKRMFDFLFGIALLLLLLPVFLVCILLVLLFSGWPIFYISWRVGEGAKKAIPVLKFRSMVTDADTQKKAIASMNERSDGPLFKVHNDPRVTSVGRFLRRWSLDELPQLCNVFLGQLSLVGPRPHLPEEVHRYTTYQRRVFAVKPGITGFAQISGRSDLSFEEEVRLDLQYIEEWSLLSDLWILWRTIFVVLGRKGAD